MRNLIPSFQDRQRLYQNGDQFFLYEFMRSAAQKLSTRDLELAAALPYKVRGNDKKKGIFFFLVSNSMVHNIMIRCK
jgi:hypothetical protein